MGASGAGGRGPAAHALARGRRAAARGIRGPRPPVRGDRARRSRRDRPDVLVTDIDLGSRPNGMEMATIVHARAPHCATVFLTNYPRASIATGEAFRRARVPRQGGARVRRATRGGGGIRIGGEAAAASAPSRRPGCRPRSPHPDPTRCAALYRARMVQRRDRPAPGVESAQRREDGDPHLRRAGVNHNPDINPRVAAAQLYVRRFGLPAESD